VKAIYGRAFRCAHPECKRPLYKQDNETGDQVLNSRVAHIHARRSGGPRWKPMTSEENRGPANLLLLCIEHSYEVDERPELFPAEMLREWKRAQLEEYERVQRAWPLSDVDVGRVLEASSKTAERVHADAVVGTVRAVERLSLTAKEGRLGPAAAAETWRATRRAARASFGGWDQDGISVYAEPSRVETEQRRTALLAALGQVAADLEPLAREAKVELAAVRASRPAVEAWCEWVSRQIDRAVEAAARWPEPPGLEDDGGLDAALDELSVSVAALTAAWRGETAPPPPKPVPSASSDLRAVDPLQAHRELLELARPYSRVDHRPYDADLRSRLATATEEASTVPPVFSALSFDLSATCRLAAAVARNANDDEFGRLVEQDRYRRPLCAAFRLLEETRQLAEDQGRGQVATLARDALVAVWEETDWSDPDVWAGSETYGEVIFWVASRVMSEAQVKGRLASALASQPTILHTMVVACAPWEEKRDHDDLSRVLGCTRHYRRIPPWFPTEAATAAAAAIAPHSAPAEHTDDADDAESLLSQVLYLAQTA
jgi:hypothetical protein